MLKADWKSTALITSISVVSVVWLFHTAVTEQSLAHGIPGVIICALVYLLVCFNERRLDEMRRAEAEQRRHVEEMATIHMNTIESLAIAIDAKDQTTHGHVRRTQIYATEMGRLFNVSEQ